MDKKALNRMNERPRGRGPAAYVAPGAVVAGAALAMFSYILAALVLLAGLAVAFLL